MLQLFQHFLSQVSRLFVTRLILILGFGRKTLMSYISLLIAADLIVLCFVFNEKISVGIIILILTFVALFEFSMGPIVWIYLSETMCEKGFSFALFINLVLTIVMSATMKSIIGAINGYIYLIFGVCSFLVTINFFY